MGETMGDNSYAVDLNEGFSSAPPLLDGISLRESVSWYPPPTRAYSRRELLVDRMVNFSGVLLGCIGSIVLCIRSSGDGALRQFGVAVYCVGIITMLKGETGK